MEKVIRLMSAGMLMAGMMTTVPALAQQKEVVVEGKKIQEDIVIRKKGDSKEKLTVVIDGDKVTINGKPADEYKGENVMVIKQKSAFEPFNFNFNQLDMVKVAGMGNKAVLGVVTEKVSDGAKITEVTKASGAEKAGLKAGDVITGINDKKIESPDDLVKAIGDFKADEKITVKYKRDGKAASASATLGKRETSSIRYFNAAPGIELESRVMQDHLRAQALNERRRITTVPGRPGTITWTNTDRPKLGVSVQDTEEGKGVKVIDVDEGSPAATAGIKEGDIILSFEGKEVNDAAVLSHMVKEAKDKKVIALKMTRDGKTINAEVKVPRKLKTADL